MKRLRKIIFVLIFLSGSTLWLIKNPANYEKTLNNVKDATENAIQLKDLTLALADLQNIPEKGRAPKTGYTRTEFYTTWPVIDGCNLRQRIIKREFKDKAILQGCDVIGGEYLEPYNGDYRKFHSKAEISKQLQIDHVVALSDAWQKGAQELTKDKRYELATDPLNLIAADGPANMQKGDGDAATWLPKNKAFRCEYVARQTQVKKKYSLWMTTAEKSTIRNLLTTCITNIKEPSNQLQPKND